MSRETLKITTLELGVPFFSRNSHFHLEYLISHWHLERLCESQNCLLFIYQKHALTPLHGPSNVSRVDTKIKTRTASLTQTNRKELGLHVTLSWSHWKNYKKICHKEYSECVMKGKTNTFLCLERCVWNLWANYINLYTSMYFLYKLGVSLPPPNELFVSIQKCCLGKQ